MTISINSLTASLLYEYLDKSEGKNNTGDNKIGAKAWNAFIDETGVKGNKITYSIFKNRTDKSYGALVSLSSYLRKSDMATKQKIVDYLNNLEQNFEEKPTVNPDNTPVQAPEKKPDNQETPVVQQTIPPEKKPEKTEPNRNNNRTVLASSDFSSKTQSLNAMKFQHKTNLLNVAEQHLGLKEVTRREFQLLSPEEKAQTQYAMIGRYGDISEAWCAHTMSTLCQKAGVPIGSHKKAVQEFINWGRNRGTYRPIRSSQMNSANILQEQQRRSRQLQAQLANIHEGDFMIMKNQYIARTQNAGDLSKKASHIMMVENIDVEKGIITVIEGNANEAVYKDSKRMIVQNSREGINGNQSVGEFQELNRRDGLIRKQYTVQELAANGYSGYIDNSAIV